MRTLSFIYLSIFMLLSGCASYVDSIHNQIDRETGSRAKLPPNYDKFDVYRKKNGQSNLVSTASQKNIGPSIKRQYGPEQEVKKRYTSDDIYDNSSENSLWNGQGKDSFLFTQDSKKRQGDIILINVMNKMKNDITAELKRVFPVPQPMVKKDDKKKTKGKEDETKEEKVAEAKPEEDAAAGAPDQVHDKISSVVVEEINKDHMLLSGRKNILFKNRKHLIEIQALVNRRNISSEDAVNSDEIIETNITVLR